jgi:protein involved in polysaccharide export with SLBB domain
VGDVQRPGAYDVSSLSSPLNVLYAAGGPTAVGSLRTLEHYRGKQLIGKVDLYDFLLHGIRDGEDRLQGGDTLIIPASGPQVAVWGAVRRPAIYELKGETTLAGLLDDAGGMTVAASLGHIGVERIDANQHRETITFDFPSTGDADKARAALAAFQIKDGDRIHIAPIAPYSERVIYLEGHVVRPGRHPYREGMHLSDVLKSYQDLLPEPAAQGEIIRLVPPDLHAQTIEFDVPEALIGNGNLSLQPFDTIRILGRYEVDAPKVDVRGEVLRPGSYPLSEGMTASQLVRMAGGFKRDALLDRADLMSYRVINGTKVESQRTDVRIGDAVRRADSTADSELKAGDVLTIHQITGWNDIGASITVEGEVAHPGSYGFQDGEHLSDVLRRAGGFRETAYPAGAILTRDQVRELEEKSRVELIHQIETASQAARLSANIGSTDQAAQNQLIQQQQEQILARLRSQPATGRLVIRITADIGEWAGTPADIEVRRGDVLRVPKRPGFVLVSGQVYNASAITFVPGKSAGWYLQHAGGTTGVANRKEIFVIRANGSVVGRGSSEWYGPDVLSTRLEPGDVVVVPQKIIGASMFWRNLLTTAQLASSIAITAALAGL